MKTSIHPPTSATLAAELAELVERLTARLKARESVDLDELTRAHPAHADELRRLLPAIQMLADLSGSPESGPAPVVHGELALAECIGDFRILREVGRGGMGVVYEAEQESLGRHVALKVLPSHALLDPQRLRRFQREARSAARLHHTNISDGQGIGGGVYNLGTFTFDVTTVIAHNHASTSNDDIFT